jgi:hypothetical protein
MGPRNKLLADQARAYAHMLNEILDLEPDSPIALAFANCGIDTYQSIVSL